MTTATVSSRIMYKNISSELKPITCSIVQPKKGACVSQSKYCHTETDGT